MEELTISCDDISPLLNVSESFQSYRITIQRYNILGYLWPCTHTQEPMPSVPQKITLIATETRLSKTWVVIVANLDGSTKSTQQVHSAA
jgi:hypothetical protein